MSEVLAKKFRRVQPEIRRETLVQATLRCLAEHGHAGVSARRIAAAAGVSPGLISHHYPSIGALVAYAYEQVATGTLDAVMVRVTAAGNDPAERLHAFFVAHFSPLVLDPRQLNVWLAFWSLIPHHPELQAVQRRTYAAFRRELEMDLAALAARAAVAGFDAARAALGLSALLDGLWIELCLNPASFPPELGVALCQDWVEGRFLRAPEIVGPNE